MSAHKQDLPAAQPPWVGQPLQRKEEMRLVRGKGKFVDDIQLRDMLYLQFVRSPYAHAEIKNVDTSAAEKSPGVVCTLTGAEVAQLTDPFFEIGPDPSSKILDYSLAVTRARYQGEQLAAPALRIHIDKVRVQTHDIGGSFGIKITNYPQMTACALASRKAGGKPVKWVESRSEHMTSSAHGNERTFRDTGVALDKDGVITAIASRHIDDCGAYPRYEPLGCVIWSQVFPGVYRFKNARIDFTQAVSNKCPVGPNRGYSRMQHLWFLERVIDICAHELGIPADEMRLRNYIRPEEFPYTTPNGCVYDSGNYPKMLALAKKLIGWDEWQKKQAQARREGRLMGIGIGTTLDSGTNNFGQSQIVNPHAPFSGNSQGANVKLDIYGEIVVAVGSCPQGQGHETTAAQVVADVLGVQPDMVTVRTGFDTDRNVHTGFSGTYASQFAVSGLSAVHGAAQKLKAEMKRLAAFVLACKEEDLEFGSGTQRPELRAKRTGKSINYWGLANIV